MRGLTGLIPVCFIVAMGACKKDESAGTESSAQEQAADDSGAAPTKAPDETTGQPSAPAGTEPVVSAPAVPVGADPVVSPGDPNLVVMKTSAGEITFVLDAERAPKSAANVLHHVNAGFYDGLVFHRAIEGALVQTGAYGPDAVRKKPLRGSVPLEIHPALGPKDGAVLLSRALANDSGSCELMFLVGDQPELQGEYAVIGMVLRGMDVVRKMAASPTERRGAEADWPTEPVTITRASAGNKPAD